jgi:hypothetical protein
VNDVNDEKVRRLLDDLAGDVRPDPGLGTPTLRRARRRRVVNATLAGVLATTFAVGALAIAGTILPTTPAPRPGTPPVVSAADRLPSIWPEGNRPEVRAAQQRVDEGEDAWRTDPEATALHFATDVLDWDGVVHLVPDGGATGAGETPSGASDVLLEVGAGVSGHGGPVELRLRQLAGRGEGGVWSVTEVRAAGIHLRSPVPGQRVGFGQQTALAVSGTLASAQPVVRIQIFDGPPVGRPLEESVTDVRPVERLDELLPSAYSSSDGAVTLVVRSERDDGTIVAATMFALTVPRAGQQPDPTEQPTTPPAAPIEVESPVAGASVTSPVAVSGTADVFEATVSMEVRDELGRVVGSGFATATCGTGCRGDYQARVRFKVDHEQAGTIVVYEANPSDQGHRRLFPVTVPVRLLPSSPPPTAAIVVDEPIENAQVSSPVLVSGTADVFEGTVSIRILDENGAILSEDFTTATCGSGCQGTYRTRVRFLVDHKQRGSIQVFESSAENGEPLHMVEIPVTLLP